MYCFFYILVIEIYFVLNVFIYRNNYIYCYTYIIYIYKYGENLNIPITCTWNLSKCQTSMSFMDITIALSSKPSCSYKHTMLWIYPSTWNITSPKSHLQVADHWVNSITLRTTELNCAHRCYVGTMFGTIISPCKNRKILEA